MADQQQRQQQQQPQRSWSWSELLDTGSQTLNLATAATSAGFSAASFFTNTGLQIAKAATQYSLALPAFAYDAAAAAAAGGPQSGDATRTVHAVVGSLFDGISMLALGAVDISGHITSAALGAASTGLASIQSAIASELARSLASFARLVQRNWNHVDNTLPPGGIPQYSVLHITRALTAWVSIQLVTRPQHEQRILAGLQELDVATLQHDVKQLVLLDRQQRQRREQQAQHQHSSSTPAAAAAADQPRITSESRIGTDGGDVITAEIGHSHAATAAAPLTLGTDATRASSSALPNTSDDDSKPLSPAQTMLAFERYSRLVLGIYGGVALRYMGVDVPQAAAHRGAAGPNPAQHAAAAAMDETTMGAGVVPPPPEAAASSAPTSGSATQQDRDAELKNDEADFLAAAATLDLTQTYAEAEAAGLMPRAWGGGASSGADGTDRINFVLDPEHVYGSTAVERDHNATPGFLTPPPNASASSSSSSTVPAAGAGATTSTTTGNADAGPAPAPAPAAEQPSFNVLDHDQRPPMAYSLIDLISGKHDDDVFHQLAGLQRGHAQQGIYSSTAYRSNGRPVPSRPKFYVVTDHAARKVVLVLRGTLSFGDVAADLTCDSVPYENMDAAHPSPYARTTTEGASGPATAMEQDQDPDLDPPEDAPPSRGLYHDDEHAYVVHEGIYHTALAIGGSREAPVHRAVCRALETNPGYDLDITGHSLGAGLAALLALLWVGMPSPSPSSSSSQQQQQLAASAPTPVLQQGRTSAASGLPPGRRLHAYCFGVPCVMSAPLGRACAPFISSWTHSWDIVSRFSLGHVLDIRNAIAWMAYEERVAQAAERGDAEAAAAAARAAAKRAAREERRKAKEERRRLARREAKKAGAQGAGRDAPPRRRRSRRGAGYAERERELDAAAAAAASATDNNNNNNNNDAEDEVGRAARAVAADAAAALADRGEPVVGSADAMDVDAAPVAAPAVPPTVPSVAAAEDEDEDDEDDDEEEEEEEEEKKQEPAPAQPQRNQGGPPFDMTNLIKQAFAHIASTPRQPPAPSANTAAPPQPQPTAQPLPDYTSAPAAAAQTAYDFAASFLSRASQPRFANRAEEEEEAARRQTEQVFWGLRRTLEANMRHVELYPPGDVLITYEDGDLLRPAYPFPAPAPAPAGAAASAGATPAEAQPCADQRRRRLFLLKDEGERGMGKRQDVFGQIEFRTGFMARHLPHVYSRTLKVMLDP